MVGSVRDEVVGRDAELAAIAELLDGEEAGSAVLVLAGEAGDYPLEVCAIDTDGKPITGVVWLVQGNRVAAVSPRWGDDIACRY
jgi:hypothetical protein